MILTLLIVGVILLVIGYMVPMPVPLSLIVRVAGAAAAAIGVVLLLVGVFSGTIAVHAALAAMT